MDESFPTPRDWLNDVEKLKLELDRQMKIQASNPTETLSQVLKRLIMENESKKSDSFDEWKKRQINREMEEASRPLPLNTDDVTFLHIIGISSK